MKPILSRRLTMGNHGAAPRSSGRGQAIFVAVPFFLAAAGLLIAGEPVVSDGAPSPQAPEEELTLFPIPNYSGDFLTRDALTGDWGGFRTGLADRGIQFEFNLNSFYQGVVDGARPGFTNDWQYYGTVDYHLKLDTGKAGLWPGGFLDVHAQSFFGDPKTDGGVLLPTNLNYALGAPYGDGTYLPHITYVQFLSTKFAVMLGKINTAVGDPNAFTGGGVGIESFMNMAFAFNPVTVHVSPYSTLAAGVIYLPTDKVTIGLTAFDSDGNMEDDGFDTVFNGNTTYVGQVQVKTNFFDRPGTQRALFMYSTKAYSVLDQDPRLNLPGPGVAPGLLLPKEDGSWNASWNFDQYLTDNWGIFGRVGFSDGDTNLIEQFYSAGIGGKGIIPGRENDQFGIGFFYEKFSDTIIDGLVLEDQEYGMEVFYNLAVTPWSSLTADVQIIEPADKRADTTTILGLRGVVKF